MAPKYFAQDVYLEMIATRILTYHHIYMIVTQHKPECDLVSQHVINNSRL